MRTYPDGYRFENAIESKLRELGFVYKCNTYTNGIINIVPVYNDAYFIYFSGKANISGIDAPLVMLEQALEMLKKVKEVLKDE